MTDERPIEPQTATERSRRFQDRLADITARIDKARKEINWNRRRKAEENICLWIDTYCLGILIEESPPEKGKEILNTMETAIRESRNTCLQICRGFGKTSLSECLIIYALALGIRKFPVIVSNNARQSQNILNDLYRILSEPDTNFAQDYPELCLPFLIANGSFRRRMTYNGIDCELSKTQNQINFARLVEKDGEEKYGGCLAVRGITGSLRGLKYHSLRPDFCLLDDIQDDESATSPEQVEKIESIIKKTIYNLSGKGKISLLACLTPIAPEDLAEKIEKDRAWNTVKFPAVIKWPVDILKNPDSGKWAQYIKLYDSELAQKISHEKSLSFYRQNYAEMNEGAEVINPNRFKISDFEISGLQSLINTRHLIGEEAFDSEYQMTPKKYTAAINITPSMVLRQIDKRFQMLQIPTGFIFNAAAIDLNPSYGATCLIASFKPDLTMHILLRKVFKMHIDQALNETQYNQGVYDKLVEIVREIKGTGVKIEALGIDAGGRNWNAVCNFCSNSRLWGIPCCAMSGRSAQKINLYPRNKLRNAFANSVLCGNEAERIKSGSGQKWIAFNSDWGKESFQRAFLSPIGSPGSVSLFDGTADEHTDLAIQVCNERLLYKKTQSDGRDFYNWKSKEKHDYLDCGSMLMAIAEQNGISGSKIIPKTMSNIQRKTIRNYPQKKRIRII